MQRSALAVVTVLLALSGCSASTGGSRQPEVLASAYPFAWAAGQVAGPDARVTDLVKPGVEPHDIELSPRQVAAFQDAAVVVYLQGFQPAVDKAAGEAPRAARLDLAPVVRVGDDPHVWLDPVLMRVIVRAIATKLVERDPANAAGYRNRAAAAESKLGQLDASLTRGLANCRSRDIVTSHAAFAYLARRYGLNQVGIAGLSPVAEPAPGRLAQVAAYARRNRVTTIFFESLVDPKIAQTVAAEVGAKTAVLDPLEGVRNGDDYLSVMARNLVALRTALGCT